jgi:FtsP/CotA-like multicopper oxidase with cupredoxin domain
MNTPRLALFAATLAALLAGCASAPQAQLAIPPALQPPGDTKLFLDVFATGVQIYQCAQKADSTFEWVFKSPEATLTAKSGAPVGKHYAGPTWEAADGSTVVGEVKARDPGPSASAIPWLLLAAKSSAAAGTFASTRFVQRVATAGGNAPASGCAESSVKNEARVPYTASYLFYR